MAEEEDDRVLGGVDSRGAVTFAAFMFLVVVCSIALISIFRH